MTAIGGGEAGFIQKYIVRLAAAATITVVTSEEAPWRARRWAP